MIAQRHIIKRQVLELQISNTADAQQLQTEVSRIYRQRIVPLIERYCSELSAPERIHRIDSLELNLGTVDPQHLEEDLVAKVISQLRALLAEQITADERRAEGAGTNRTTASYLELFSIFAQTGSLPWWTDSSSPHLLDDCLQYLIHNAPGPLRRLMRELAQDQHSLQRIMHHGDDRLLADLAAVLAPSLDLPALAHMVRDLALLLSSTTIGAGQRQTRLRHLVWGVILQQLSLRGEYETAWPPFLQAVLLRLAAERGATYTALLSGMHQSVRHDPVRFQSPIGAITETLYTELLRTPGPPLPPAEEGPGAGVGQWSDLAPLLRTLAAQLPAPSQAPLVAAVERLAQRPTDQEAITALLHVLRSALLHQHLPPALVPHWGAGLEALAVLGVTPGRLQALTELLQAVLPQLPAPLARVAHPASNGRRPGAGSRGAPETISEKELPFNNTAHLPPAGGGKEGGSRGGEATQGNTVRAVPPSNSPPLGGGSGDNISRKSPEMVTTPLDLTFSDADALYIGNAGLVILHPFLRHFCERLDLLEDRQWKDVASRQRAVGLLQYAVSEDPSPPEYLLPLNKTLCGMELDDVFDFGPPVTEAEADECTNLLTAAIANAPILKNMSVNGLRGTFLLRQGVLSSRDGAWLLRVERETYDVVLDRFPWTMQWVKLPWMDTPLRVEW